MGGAMTPLPGRVVVLGGGGFIGSNLVRRLVELGADVDAVDIAFPEFRAEALVGARKVHANLLSRDETWRAIRHAGTVFHLAADMGGVGYFHSDADLGAAMRNGQITLNVLEAVQRLRIERTFYASSACAYPTQFQQNILAAPPLEEGWVGCGTPDACYGAEKLHGLRLVAKVPGARVGILHTVYGPGQEHEGRRMKFPAAVARKALAARRTGTLELWGDGKQLRSYHYVDDAVKQILTITSSPDYWGPVNVGAAGAISCRDVAEICLAHAGAPDATITTNPAEPSGVLARDCSTRKYVEHYGAVPGRTYPAGFGAFLDWLDTVWVDA